MSTRTVYETLAKPPQAISPATELDAWPSEVSRLSPHRDEAVALRLQHDELRQPRPELIDLSLPVMIDRQPLSRWTRTSARADVDDWTGHLPMDEVTRRAIDTLGMGESQA